MWTMELILKYYILLLTFSVSNTNVLSIFMCISKTLVEHWKGSAINCIIYIYIIMQIPWRITNMFKSATIKNVVKGLFHILIPKCKPSCLTSTEPVQWCSDLHICQPHLLGTNWCGSTNFFFFFALIPGTGPNFHTCSHQLNWSLLYYKSRARYCVLMLASGRGLESTTTMSTKLQPQYAAVLGRSSHRLILAMASTSVL